METEILVGSGSTMTAGFTASVDSMGEREWDEHLALFRDASIYQTWAYGAVSWGQKNLSHLVLKKGNVVVGMAQFRILRVPLVAAGIAYLRWGPLYQLRNAAEDRAVLSALFKEISKEYGGRRHLLIRILPCAFEGTADAQLLHSVCAEVGFQPNTTFLRYRTIRVDLTVPPEEMRKRLDQKWRNQLNAAERNGLQVLEGTSDELFERFSTIYKEMLARKQFETTVDVDEFSTIQGALPPNLKMVVLLCEKEGKLMAGVVGAAVGHTGIYLLGATSAEGMKAKGSYLLQWRMMQLLRQRGCLWYDLGGINPERNPGVHHFKSGFGGQEVTQCHRLEFRSSSLSALCVSAVESIKNALASSKAGKHPQKNLAASR
jgi:hypothetical protein